MRSKADRAKEIKDESQISDTPGAFWGFWGFLGVSFGRGAFLIAFQPFTF